jgi:hypothetical protein
VVARHGCRPGQRPGSLRPRMRQLGARMASGQKAWFSELQRADADDVREGLCHSAQLKRHQPALLRRGLQAYRMVLPATRSAI